MARENIPGLSVHYKDGGLIVPVIDGPITDTVLVIGSAVDGPVGVISEVTPAQAEYLYGPVVYNSIYDDGSTSGTKDTYNGNSLIKGMNEVRSAGATTVRLLRVGGVTATAAATGSGGIHPFTVEGYYPGAVYNDILVTFNGSTSVTITPSAAGKGPTITLSFPTGSTYLDVINQVNTDVNNRSIKLVAQYTSSLTASWLGTTSGTSSLTLAGGLNQTVSKMSGTQNILPSAYYNMMTDTTTGAFTVIQDTDEDIVYLTGIYADTSIDGTNATSVVTKLAEACFLASVNSYPKLGVIGLTPLYQADVAGIASRVTSLTSSTAGWHDQGQEVLKFGNIISATKGNLSKVTATDPRTGATIDTGRYVQVVAGPDVLLSHKTLGNYIDNPAGLYAGFLTTLKPQSSTTNKMLPGAQTPIWDYTTAQVNLLAGGQPATAGTPPTFNYGGAYVVLRKNVTGSYVVNMDNTIALRTSDYKRLQILRIVNAIVEGIRTIGMPFLGEPNSFATRIAMKNKIKNFLDAVAESGAIAGGENEGYSFSVTSNTVDALLGRVRIELQVRPMVQLDFINVTITLAPPVGG